MALRRRATRGQPVPVDRDTPVARTVLDHPRYRTEREALSLPMASPRVLTVAYDGRRWDIRGTHGRGTVTLLYGHVMIAHPADAELIRARRATHDTVRARVGRWLRRSQ